MKNNSAYKIMAVSCLAEEAVAVYGVYAPDDKILIIAEFHTTKKNSRRWRKDIKKDVLSKMRNGHSVIIEEGVSDISEDTGAEFFDFEDMHGFEKRQKLSLACDLSMGMVRANRLEVTDKLKPFILTEGQLDIEYDDNNKRKYRIQWDNFTARHRAILMAVYASHYFPVSKQFFNDLYGDVGKEGSGGFGLPRTPGAIIEHWVKSGGFR